MSDLRTLARRMAVCCALAGMIPAGAQTGAELAKEIREAGVDPTECYRVRNLHFAREDLKFYLTEGYLAFSRPVAGRRVTAVFSADVEAGDAEVILLPPNRSERRSLASYTDSPNLDERFSSAFFVLGDSLAAQLIAQLRQSAAKDPEAGARLDAQFSPVMQNLSASFEMRLVEELLGPGGDELFVAVLRGLKRGVFDLACDPRAREQIVAGQFAADGAPGRFNIWTSFESQSVRRGLRKRAAPPFAMPDFRIDASLADDLHLAATTRARIVPAVSGLRALAFGISDRMRITGARLDGREMEVFARESPQESALRGATAATFLAIAPSPLAAGQAYEIEFTHEGDIVESAGEGVFFVGARNTWYPNVGAEFANFDVNFRFPASLTLVGTGALVSDRREGDFRVTRRQTTVPIRMAGFNLGDYRRRSVVHEGYTVDVYSNRAIEDALRQAPLPMILLPPFPGPGRKGSEPVMLSRPPGPNPAAEASTLAGDVAGAMAYFASLFGPPPVKTITVSPIPGAFGQGFPGLLYISTLAYLRPQERPAGARGAPQQTFFSDMLATHEAAHQWWGNLVASESYEDDWLMEALANYSALLYIEKRRGARAIEPILDEFRANLLARTPEGGTVESTGPITWGARLEHTRSSDAWRTITYDKGAWIVHMLRRRMGDERFFKMLAEMCRRYRFRALSTVDFRGLVKEFMPRSAAVDDFFESWVYGTGIPALKTTFSVKGKAPARLNVTVAQSEVDEGFSCEVPVEVYFEKSAPIVRWIATSTDPVTVSVTLPEPPSRVVLLPGTSVLARK
jgi:hypothetical protein